jgi:hypothetical protein
MTRSDLLEVVYRFYPRGLLIGTRAYNDTAERRRQREVARRGVAEYAAWGALLDRLRPRYRLQNHSLRMLGDGYLEGSYDPAYSGHVRIPGRALGFHVCLLGPYYGIHRTGAPGEEPAAIDLAREIEATYPGYQPIPPELGNEVVADVVDLGKTTIYVCLLSDVWEGSSWADDDAEPLARVEVLDPGAAGLGSSLPIRWRSHERRR